MGATMPSTVAVHLSPRLHNLISQSNYFRGWWNSIVFNYHTTRLARSRFKKTCPLRTGWLLGPPVCSACSFLESRTSKPLHTRNTGPPRVLKTPAEWEDQRLLRREEHPDIQRIHTSRHTYIHASIHPYIDTSIHTYIQTYTHPYIHP